VLDNEVHSAPSIRTRIGASGQIDMGRRPWRRPATWRWCCARARSPRRSRSWSSGPSDRQLGQDSIDQGQLAGIIGITLVILIMMVYYRFSGVLAIWRC
jgi:preprotein translocase subunit SecD